MNNAFSARDKANEASGGGFKVYETKGENGKTIYKVQKTGLTQEEASKTEAKLKENKIDSFSKPEPDRKNSK